jgi:enediyne biosynthesis protein E4
VTCVGSNVLYHNNGDGTFRAVTSEANADCPLWSTGAAFGDFDRDGDLDLFVANYVDFDPKSAPTCGDPHTGQRSYCGPSSFGPLPDVLFENNGDGTFSDVSTTAGVNLPDGRPRPESKGLGVQIADFDDDGWLDIFVANDQTPNFLFHNEGGLKFFEVGQAQGVALTGEGATTATMGIACGDYDGDGRLDLFTTNFYLEGSTLYHNVGRAGFRDVTAAAGLASSTRSVLGWGTAFLDIDNDGWLDLFATNGHVQRDPSGLIPYAMHAQVFRNTGRGNFADVSSQAGPYFMERWNGRGAAVGDIDNDGDTDIVVVHHHQPAAILRNDTQQGGYLSLRLIGVQSDRDALGTKVTFTLDESAVDLEHGRQLVRCVDVSGSYLSSGDARILVGLGAHEGAIRMEVRWNSGALQRRATSSRNSAMTLREELSR